MVTQPLILELQSIQCWLWPLVTSNDIQAQPVLKGFLDSPRGVLELTKRGLQPSPPCPPHFLSYHVNKVFTFLLLLTSDLHQLQQGSLHTKQGLHVYKLTVSHSHLNLFNTCLPLWMLNGINSHFSTLHINCTITNFSIETDLTDKHTFHYTLKQQMEASLLYAKAIMNQNS